jgi:callose synthase
MLKKAVLSLLQLKRVMESDSASTEDLIAYNIIPIDAASSTNAIVFFPEVLKLLYLRSLFYM